MGRIAAPLISSSLAPLLALAVVAAQDRHDVRRISWDDVTAFHNQLNARQIDRGTFGTFVARTYDENVRRVREGDLDHLVFYILQSTRFTKLPPIEPALSAKSVVDALGAEERQGFLAGSSVASAKVPATVRARLTAFLRAIDSPTEDDPRLAYFRDLVRATIPDGRQREGRLAHEYLRAMRFVYKKEFVAQKAERPAEAIAALYRSRGLSTDTAVEAGFLVHYGLGIAKGLDAKRRVRRVLIIGPGLDLAPRTSFADDRPPESYQPWAIIDALLSLDLSRPDDLDVVAADINPRVVDHLNLASRTPPTLTLVSEIRESDTITLSEDYQSYFAELGRRIGKVDTPPRRTASGHLRKEVAIDQAVARHLTAVALDIVTERLDEREFDLVVATNILPYFDDLQLMLTVSNIAAMVAPGGVFLHNEARPVLGELTEAVGLRFEQSRHAVIATVQGAATPLFDSVWLHRRLR